jgi:hypothetical protein
MQLAALLIGMLADPAYAVTITDAMNTAGANLPTGGGSNFGSIISTVAGSFVPLVLTAGSLAIIIAGFFLTVTGNETQVATGKRVLIAGIAAIILVKVGPAFLSALIGVGFSVTPGTLAPSGTTILSNPLGSGGIISAEALGIIDFIAVPLGILCVVMIIISGVRAIANFGSEDGVTQLRRTVLFVVAGFILVASRVFLGGFVTFSGLTATAAPTNIITKMLDIVSAIIGLIVVLAVAMLVYAGILMIANVGKDDQYAKAKGLIVRVAIGLIILLASGGIVLFLRQVICNGAVGPCA